MSEALSISLSANPANKRVLITLTPPTKPEGSGNDNTNDAGQRTPLDICCVIDVSGSMATTADSKGNPELMGLGLNVLDIVKHSVKTIVATMQEGTSIYFVYRCLRFNNYA
jgi:hypothetical protein